MSEVIKTKSYEISGSTLLASEKIRTVLLRFAK